MSEKTTRKLDGEAIASVFNEHRTSYTSRTNQGWDWSCACGEKGYAADHEFCERLTCGHWANVIGQLFAIALREERRLGLRDGLEAGKLLSGERAVLALFCEKHKSIGDAASQGYIRDECPTCEIERIKRETLGEAAKLRCPFCRLTNSGPVLNRYGLWVHYPEADEPTKCEAYDIRALAACNHETIAEGNHRRWEATGCQSEKNGPECAECFERQGSYTCLGH